MQLSDSVDCPVNAQMQQLTVEAAALVFCLKLYNPETQNAFVNGKMDEGCAVSAGPGMYPMLLVSTFTLTAWSTSVCPALSNHSQHSLAPSRYMEVQIASKTLGGSLICQSDVCQMACNFPARHSVFLLVVCILRCDKLAVCADRRAYLSNAPIGAHLLLLLCRELLSCHKSKSKTCFS